VAIAHDYLNQRGGAERVVLAMAQAFPDAQIHTTLYDPAGTYPEFADRRVIVSPLNRIAWLRRHHRVALLLLPLAAQVVRPRAQVVLVSSSGFAHGFRSEGRRLVYCHAPARWLYQPREYLGLDRRPETPGVVFGTAVASSWVLRAALAVLRPSLTWWDRRAARSADRYLTNSRVVRDRVRAAYGIDAKVLAPPMTLDALGDQTAVPTLTDWADTGYHLVVSRLLPYKHVDRVIAAFAGMPSRRLVVVGDGPGAARIAADLPENVRLLRTLTDAELRWVYAHSAALVAASFEDFGLTPLEAGAFGKPTIALGAGGYLDTVVPGVTGIFFPEVTAAAIAHAVAQAARHTWSAEAIREHADRFSLASFIASIRAEVELLLESVGPAPLEDHATGAPKDAKVAGERPVLDVVEIKADAVLP
jgi:glycosyltransferase involved in cell wall biosynthesis